MKLSAGTRSSAPVHSSPDRNHAPRLQPGHRSAARVPGSARLLRPHRPRSPADSQVFPSPDPHLPSPPEYSPQLPRHTALPDAQPSETQSALPPAREYPAARGKPEARMKTP